MFRLFLHWLPDLLRLFLWALFCTSTAVGVGVKLEVAPVWTVIAAAVCGAAPFWRYGFLLFRFGGATWYFRTVAGQRVILHYAPGVEGRIDLQHCLDYSDAAQTNFSTKLGFSLRRRLVIFLFPTSASMSRVFNHQHVGFALTGGDAIGLSADRLGYGSLDEVTLHELAHLFSARVGKLEPPLKDEGLATCLMGTIDGKSIDFHALAALLTDRYVFLTWLTKPAWFFNSPNSYVLAGSFTGHLIRRVGWNRYLEFFRRAQSKDSETTFAQFFGLSLLAAEKQWRDELVETKNSFEPELTRFIGEHSVAAAYQAGQFYRCLQEAEMLSLAGQANGRVFWYAATTEMYLGHYNEAINLLKHSIEAPDPSVREALANAWLQLGNLYDLLGERENAEQAYARALAYPDYWDGTAGSTHVLARRYLGRPFSEHDLQRRLRQLTNGTPGRWRQRR